MNGSKILSIFFLLFFMSCINNTSSDQKNNINKDLKEKLEYSKAVLYSIDSSIYEEMDTVLNFRDGLPAYINFLHGWAFIDSLGQPIHDRYSKHILTNEQNQLLKDNFLYEFCDEFGRACRSVYRDVLIFYDSSEKIIAQIQICFGCGDAEIYPYKEFMCQTESNLDYTALKQFFQNIKK